MKQLARIFCIALMAIGCCSAFAGCGNKTTPGEIVVLMNRTDLRTTVLADAKEQFDAEFAEQGWTVTFERTTKATRRRGCWAESTVTCYSSPILSRVRSLPITLCLWAARKNLQRNGGLSIPRRMTGRCTGCRRTVRRRVSSIIKRYLRKQELPICLRRPTNFLRQCEP